MRAICAIVASLMLAGTVLANTINVPADYPTIQQAVDASVANDVIEVAGNHYETGSVIVPHNLTIQCSVPNGQIPILDAELQDVAFKQYGSSSNLNLNITNIDIRNGYNNIEAYGRGGCAAIDRGNTINFDIWCKLSS